MNNIDREVAIWIRQNRRQTILQREMLKSKIHRATVTDANLDYVGSLSLDPRLMAAADLLPGEKVLVANLRNGERFETYVMAGKSGEVCLNGAAARLGRKGDKVIIMAFTWLPERRCRQWHPRVVHVDSKNRILQLPPSKG